MKKYKRFVFLFLMIGLLVLVIVSVAVIYKHNSDINKKEKAVISNEIERLLKDRASIMISDEQIVSESPFISKKENLKEKELREQIAQFRDELKKSGETYLTISNTDTATGYDAEHEIILKKHKDTWKIVEDKQLEPIGLLPLNEAKKYIEK